MPDWKKLKIGDTIRILSVPPEDLAQREQEIEKGLPDAGFTANAIEKIIVQHSEVIINGIDEYGTPWYEAIIINKDGEEEIHSVAISDNFTWEFIK